MKDDRDELYSMALKICKDAGAVSECDHGLLIDNDRADDAYAAGNGLFDTEYRGFFSSREEMNDGIKSVIDDAGRCDYCS
ncbi:hypothetical protein ACTACJ_07060 [Pseudomonas syringae]|uniref:hypothetical protein n=1 Tax=Pseudomonas syringae TaxID=317 RepID=UPI003F824C9F